MDMDGTGPVRMDPPADDPGEQALRASVALGFPAGAEAPGSHPSLAELAALAAERRRRGEDWELPGHLACCPLCLEAFEALLDGAPAALPAALRRFERLGPLPARTRPRRAAPLLLKLAASVAVALAGTWAAIRIGHAPVADLADGSLAGEAGRTLTAGEKVPGRTLFRAATGSRVEFPDGTRLTTAEETVFAVRDALAGGQAVDFRGGEVLFEVAPREPGRSFIVKTPLGALEVIGTRFTVTSRAEEVRVFEHDGGSGVNRSYADTLSSVTISVHEGHVRVWNRHEEAHVRAGQSAVLRPETTMIEVLGAPRGDQSP